MAYTNATYFLDYESGSDTARSTLNIVSSTNATPIELTVTAHGQVTGAVVTVASHTTNTNANGIWKITSTGANTFTLDTSVGNGTGGASGTVVPYGGSSKADAWKTFLNGPTAARMLPGDVCRIKESPPFVSMGINGTWTQYSKTVTLASSVTQNISTCESAWTASSNVTCSTSSSDYKEGSNSTTHAVAGAFTTGKASYFATGTLDLSGYKQVSLWFKATAVTSASSLSIRLCSDTAGVTTVNTIALPAGPTASQWFPVTIDTGAALGSSIQSVALYVDTDLGAGSVTVTLDNIFACKDSTSADALTLTSLIGKVHNINWVASTTYAVNDIRIPTSPNRNGYRYKVTAQTGTTGGTEPTWPRKIGATVVDSNVTWTCEGVEDSWFALQSVNGTTLKIEQGAASLGNAGRGYGGATETVAIYRRSTIKVTPPTGSTTVINDPNAGGTYDAPVLFTGGWNSTDMTTQTGQTWTDHQTGRGTGYGAAYEYIWYENLNIVRANIGCQMASRGQLRKNCHYNHTVTAVTFSSGNGSEIAGALVGVSAHNATQYGLSFSSGQPALVAKAVYVSGCLLGNIIESVQSGDCHYTDVVSVNSNTAGWAQVSTAANITNHVNGLLSAGNSTAGIVLTTAKTSMFLKNSIISDTTPLSITNGAYVYSQNHGQVAGTNLITTTGGIIASATDQRHTASGISWKFSPTSVTRLESFPLAISLAKIAVAASAAVTVSVWTRRDSTNIKGKLVMVGGQIDDVYDDIEVDCAPSVNTWVQSSDLTFTPTEAGVVEILFYVWDGVGTTNNFWIDDVVIAQA